MDARELIEIGAERVRADGELFTAYMEIYRGLFGSNSPCGTCTFKRDFERLKKAVESEKEKPKEKYVKMDKKVDKKTEEKKEEKTFVINKEGKIKSYQKDGKIYRVYDTEMTESFAVAYLTHGTAEEIERRKAIFRTLPLSIREAGKKTK